VYGTDTPFDMGGGPLDDQLGDLALAPDARAAVGGANARSLFDLERKS
jgi:aminocarboxymuconate-semialdehyde decarboxylase